MITIATQSKTLVKRKLNIIKLTIAKTNFG
jgi:hypothetical protein